MTFAATRGDRRELHAIARGRLFAISAPAGSGKTTLAQMLCAEFAPLDRNVSYTTRSPRSGEQEGRDYHFISKEEFEQRRAAGDFVEHVHLFGHWYAVSKSQVAAQLEKSPHLLLVIDPQGVQQLRKHWPLTAVFIHPPSLSELQRRLQQRQSEDAANIAARLQRAAAEIKMAADYDYAIVNQHLEQTYQQLRAIYIAERYMEIRKSC